MSFLSYISRINIEIGKSFIHRSFPRRVECPYLSEWEHTKLAMKQEKPSTVLAVVFSAPFPFLSLRSSLRFSLCLRFCYLCFTFVALLEGSSLFSFVRFFIFCSLYTPVCLPLTTAVFLLRFSLFIGARRRSILSGRSSLDQWPGRKLEYASTL